MGHAEIIQIGFGIFWVDVGGDKFFGGVVQRRDVHGHGVGIHGHRIIRQIQR